MIHEAEVDQFSVSWEVGRKRASVGYAFGYEIRLLIGEGTATIETAAIPRWSGGGLTIQEWSNASGTGVHPSARHRDTGWMEHIVRVASREVYRSRWMTMREDEIRRLDGSYGSYGVIDRPDYALVIARDGDRFCLVEQFRYPLGLRRWEFPQGSAPDRVDVEPAALAEQELREETGLRADSMVFLGLLDVAAGMSSQRGRVFLATGITEGQHEREHEEQDMHSAWFSRGELEQMIVDGEITDAQSIAAWALFLLVPQA